MEPEKGSLAFCQAGYFGLILNIREDETVNNVSTPVYRGIHLNKERFGSPWQSTNPKVVGHISEMAGMLSLNLNVK